MSSDFLFYAMLTFLFTHELDAVGKHEWRMLPFAKLMSDRASELAFIWLHVPLLLIILWFAGSNPNSVVGLLLSGFAIVHVGLHWYFLRHPLNEFTTFGSWALILAAGLFGALHLLFASL